MSIFNLQEGGTRDHAESTLVDSKEGGYPEYNSFGITPAYGINCKYVRGLRIANVVTDYQITDSRPAFYFQDSEDVSLSAIQAKVSDQAPAYIRFNNQNGAIIMNSRPRSGKVPFCGFEGKTKDITIMNNDLRKAKAPYVGLVEVDVKEISVSGF